MDNKITFGQFVEAIVANEIWVLEVDEDWSQDAYCDLNTLGFIHRKYQRYLNSDGTYFHIGKEPPKTKTKQGQWVNRFGVDTDYFNKELTSLLTRIDDCKPDELARTLARLSLAADSEVLFSAHFSKLSLTTEGQWINRYGVDTYYFNKELASLLTHIDNCKPNELARTLARLAAVADSQVLREDELSKLSLALKGE